MNVVLAINKFIAAIVMYEIIQTLPSEWWERSDFRTELISPEGEGEAL